MHVLARRWSDIERRESPSFFLTWRWIGTWLKESALEPRVLVGRDAGTEIALALVQPSPPRRLGPLLVKRASLNEAGQAPLDSPTIEYNGVLGGGPGGGVGALLRWWSERGRDPEREDELRLTNVLASYLEAACAAGLRVRLRAIAPCYGVTLPGLRSAGDWIERLRPNARAQVRRTLRLFATMGPLRCDLALSPEMAHAWLDALEGLHQASWGRRGKPGAFAEPFFRRFLHALLDAAWPHGEIEVLRFAAGAHVLGYSCNFLHRGVVHNYVTGFARFDDNRLKPGLAGHYLTIERHLGTGARLYDLMAGGGAYKERIAQPHTTLVSFDLQRPSLPLRAEAWARGVRARLLGQKDPLNSFRYASSMMESS